MYVLVGRFHISPVLISLQDLVSSLYVSPVLVSPQDLVGSLHISRVLASDAGNFTCRVDFSEHRTRISRLKLAVHGEGYDFKVLVCYLQHSLQNCSMSRAFWSDYYQGLIVSLFKKNPLVCGRLCELKI